jgi:hypothetical protein
MSIRLSQMLVGGILGSIRVWVQSLPRSWIESKFVPHLSLIASEIIF